MSKLLDLFNSSDYARLSNMPANNGTPRTFSVRKQSNTDSVIQQENAVNFIDADQKIQTEFTVDEAKNALSATGIAKDMGTDNTKFTAAALATYDTRSTDPKLVYINNNTSKLIQRYVAPSTAATAGKQYSAMNSTAPGVVLGYTPA